MLAGRRVRQRRRRELLRHAQKRTRSPPIAPPRRELGAAVFEYIEVFCNRWRRHSTLGMLSPAEYEQTREETEIKTKEETT
jgi:transposase InsO family protein